MSSPARPTGIDLRTLTRPLRHAIVFQTFEPLDPGEHFEVVKDHDPLGLLHPFQALVLDEFTGDDRSTEPGA